MNIPWGAFVQKIKNRSNAFIIGGYVVSGLYALMIIIPLYFVVISAFKGNDQIIRTPLALPKPFDFTKIVNAQNHVNLVRAASISLLISVGAELLTLLLAFPAAYAIARVQTKLSEFAEGVFSLGFLIPGLAILMPVYLMTARSGLLHNPLALIILYPAFNLPLSIILLSSFMRKLPRELEESAVMDGGSVLQIIYHIFLPICSPGIITVLVLNFINMWNEYLFALILMDSNNRTIQLATALLRSSQRTVDYGLIASGILVSLIPVVIIFIFFQEQIMEGMLAGAVKE